MVYREFKILSCFLFVGSLFLWPTLCLASALLDFTVAIEKALPCVVSIVTISEGKESDALVPENLRQDLEGTPLMNLLEEIFVGELDAKLSGDNTGLGAGVIVSQDGYVVSSYHVVSGAEEIFVRLHDHREYPASVVGVDLGTDLALLKIEAKDLPVLPYGIDSQVKPGQWVLAIGSPFGFEHTVTAGIVSAVGRNLSTERYVPFIQTDVAINPGNSGGPLLNLQGEMIGLNSQVVSESGDYIGLSFAVPASVVKSVVDQMKKTGKVTRGWLGLVFQDVDRDLAAAFGLSSIRGALVSKVIEDSPAHKAGLVRGDVIVRFNGTEIIEAADLPPAVGVVAIGEVVQLEIIHKQQAKTLSLQLGQSSKLRLKQKANFKAPPVTAQLGIKVRAMDLAEKAHFSDKNIGVVVQKIEEAAWQDAGIRAGDVILSINQQRVETREAFYHIIKAQMHHGVIPVLVARMGEPQRYLVVKLPF